MPPSAAPSTAGLRYRHGQLELDGAPVAALLDRHATPFFLFSERRLLDNFRALESGLAEAGAALTLRYCAKTNHEAGVLQVLARAGASLLASHLAEVELAIACGFAPERIAYQRPGMTRDEIVAVLAAGVRHLHVFRPSDVDLFAELATAYEGEVRLSLRLRDERRRLSPLATLNARLGLTAAEARDVARACRGEGALAGERKLRVTALNVYIGTQQRGARAFDRELGRACALARELADSGLATIDEINLGGGVPSSSLRRLALRGLWARWRDRLDPPSGDAPARLVAFASDLARRFHRAASEAGLAPLPALALEPGRSVVGNAAIVVARVTSIEGRWLFLDASRNFLGESPVLFQRAILPLAERAGEPRRVVHLSGSTLNTTDILDLHRRLPRLTSGDAVAFCDAGAYSISRASRYAGVAPEVLLQAADGSVRTIRRAEAAADLTGPMAPAFAAASASEPAKAERRAAR